jgi:hypothetical protein
VQHDGFCHNSDNYRQLSFGRPVLASTRAGTHLNTIPLAFVSPWIAVHDCEAFANDLRITRKRIAIIHNLTGMFFFARNRFTSPTV